MTRKPKKPVIHREWFRTVSLGNRKSCPNCVTKLPTNESIWSWGEYVRAKWRTVDYFCVTCFDEVKARLFMHANTCGCEFELVGYGGEKLPEWLTLDDKTVCTIGGK